MRKYNSFWNTIITILFFIILLVLVAISFILLYKANVYSSESSDLVRFYYIGGVISGIFSFPAFIMVLVSYNNQRKTTCLQRFESTFFNMLSQQQQIVAELSYNYYTTTLSREESYKSENWEQKRIRHQTEKSINGRELFRFLFVTESILNEEYNNIFESGMKIELSTNGISSYCNYSSPSYFDHYFRHLYTIIKFVDETIFLTYKDKYRYTSIVRAILSRYELVWIYYNCLSSVGNEKFKPLIEKYSLLKNIRIELLSISKELCSLIKTYNIIEDNLKSAGFSGTDYEYLLTCKKDDKNKYYIGAFYNQKELDKGMEVLKKWNGYLKDLENNSNNKKVQITNNANPVSQKKTSKKKRKN